MTAKWVGVQWVQDKTGLARPTLYRMAREGRIPAVRIAGSRTIKFDPEVIEKWMAKTPKASS